MTSDDELTISVCWALLRSAQVSRIALSTADGPRILPVNHVVDGGTLVLRTADGTMVAQAAASGELVALEADGYDAASGLAWSVVARGHAQEVKSLHELVDLEHLPLAPWHGTPKNRFLRIEPHELTGRRFPVVDPGAWQGALSGTRRTPDD